MRIIHNARIEMNQARAALATARWLAAQLPLDRVIGRLVTLRTAQLAARIIVVETELGVRQ